MKYIKPLLILSLISTSLCADIIPDESDWTRLKSSPTRTLFPTQGSNTQTIAFFGRFSHRFRLYANFIDHYGNEKSFALQLEYDNSSRVYCKYYQGAPLNGEGGTYETYGLLYIPMRRNEPQYWSLHLSTPRHDRGMLTATVSTINDTGQLVLEGSSSMSFFTETYFGDGSWKSFALAGESGYTNMHATWVHPAISGFHGKARHFERTATALTANLPTFSDGTLDTLSDENTLKSRTYYSYLTAAERVTADPIFATLQSDIAAEKLSRIATEWTSDGRSYRYGARTSYNTEANAAPLKITTDDTQLLHDLLQNPIFTQLGQWQFKDTTNGYTWEFDSGTGILENTSTGHSWKYSKNAAGQWYQETNELGWAFDENTQTWSQVVTEASE